MLKRRDINALSDSEVDDYIHALNIVRGRSQANPDDPLGYDWHARRHNDMDVGPCEHGNDLFMAWHRCHLYYFEQVLRATDPPRTSNVCIPYWDWSRPDPAGGRYPARFQLPGLQGDRFSQGAGLHADTIRIVKDTPGWNDFGGWPRGTPEKNYGAFEIGPHNHTHGNYIGGLMGDPATAAEDPIYWSFHCFIDLVWHEWQRRNPDQSATSPTAILRGFAGETKTRVSDFQSVTALGHEYEYNAALAADFAAPSPAVPLAKVNKIGRFSPAFSGPVREQFRSSGQAAFSFSAGLPEMKRSWVVIHDVNLPKAGSFNLNVYVHPRDHAWPQLSRPEPTSPFFAGDASIWKVHSGNASHGHGGHHGEPHHPVAAHVRIEATSVIERLNAAGRADLVVTLQFIPAPMPNGSPAPVPELLRQVDLSDVVLEGVL
jgi:tyrosinase